MHLNFDPNLPYQQQAIKSVINLFEGQSADNSFVEYDTIERNSLSLISGVSNALALSEKQILKNLQKIQKENELSVSHKLDGMNFSVEMETGTGKTYVYLRTIYELHQYYGFKKFVIVVPSVAIREGVLKSLQITHVHFQNLYDNAPINFEVYDSAKVSKLRSFANNNSIEILIINIDSFAKDENVINRPNDKLSGHNPIEFIQASNPIVIIDEPQNMETENRKQAIANLNPLCTLRYSATHKNPYNLLYSLNPVKAYDLGLVKQIEVDSIIEENSYNSAFIMLESIKATKTKISAKLVINCNDKNGVKKKKVTVRVADDLYKLSNEREIYSNGYILEEIDALNESVSFSNGIVLYKGMAQGALTDEIIKTQIRKTIEEHLNKELRLNKKGIKVLSLFFIDKVANYRKYDSNGNPIKTKYAEYFEDIYKTCISKAKYKELDIFSLDEIHNGYFSNDKNGKWKDTSGETKADNETYNLIMKDKEKLLDIKNPLRFIFSHSALREGWDNPNVFQICTLNETKSDIKKRQEIGRGLRLAVDQKGNRIYERNINRLTVIANEAYDDFAKSLQQELEEDCGVDFKDRIKNRKNREKIKYRKGFQADPKFLEIWNEIKRKTTYRVDYDTQALITEAAKALAEMPEVTSPAIRATKMRLDINDKGVDYEYASDNITHYDALTFSLPDILGYIQKKTELTRFTIQDILNDSGRLKDFLVNPQLFLDFSVKAIQSVLRNIMIEGIKYQKIGNSSYEMTLFEVEELDVYLNDYSFKVDEPAKTIYENFIPLDSDVESAFAKDCETSEQIEFYFKLPSWFKIPTPIGSYNPDWAVVFKDEKKLYFVAETKNTGQGNVDVSKLHIDEQLKIKCGKAHFDEFGKVEYKVVNSVRGLLS